MFITSRYTFGAIAFSVMCAIATSSCGKKDECKQVGTGPDKKPIMRCSSSASKADVAAIEVKKIAKEAFPQWSLRNRSKTCPDGVADLVEFMSRPDAKDPWDHEYRLLCGDNLPRGVHGIAVSSAGPDGTHDTSDDIKSW